MKKTLKHQDLEVYKQAFGAAMQIFTLSRSFPRDETYSLTDQIRRSSRSVCANLAEAWRKRRYQAAKLCDCEGEAAETQTWLEFAVKCDYLSRDAAVALFKEYDSILAKLVGIINHPESWVLPSGRKSALHRK